MNQADKILNQMSEAGKSSMVTNQDLIAAFNHAWWVSTSEMDASKLTDEQDRELNKIQDALASAVKVFRNGSYSQPSSDPYNKFK